MIQLSRDQLLDKVRSYAEDADVTHLRKAYDRVRGSAQLDALSTADFTVQRPLAVADLLASLQLDVDSLTAGLLFPAVEEGRLLDVDVEAEFGGEIASLVADVVRLSRVDYRGSAEDQAESFRKMIFAMSRDVRALLVKLADRRVTLESMQHLDPRVRRRIARETMEIYAPVANRLGVQSFKEPFENLSFAELHPEVHADIERHLASRDEVDHPFIERITAELVEICAEHSSTSEIQHRVKKPCSIYRKMSQKRLILDEVADLVAFRVVVDDVTACYAVLGALHGRYEPIHERFKDYIGRAKPNGYQSLHTTVIAGGGERFEVQIRSREMHRIAELGVAAHWKYKEGRLALSRKELANYTQVRQLTRLASEIQDDQEFVEVVKVDLFSDEVYVYTPTGELRWLPLGATLLDFAFTIHTEVGLSCTGGRINGQMVPMRTKLRSGDVVEILTRKGQTPNRDWLKMVVTARARNKIGSMLRTEKREQARRTGYELVEQRLKARGVKLTKVLKDTLLVGALLGEFKVQEVDELFTRIGYGKLRVERVIELIAPEPEPEPDLPGPESLELLPVSRRAGSPIQAHGIEDMLTNFAKCCRPVQGDPIVGFITRGRGVTIHRADCKQARHLDPDRKLPVTWDKGRGDISHARVRIVVRDQSGILATLTKRIALMKVDITSLDARPSHDGYAVAVIGLSVRDRDQLDHVIRRLETLKGVVEISRV